MICVSLLISSGLRHTFVDVGLQLIILDDSKLSSEFLRLSKCIDSIQATDCRKPAGLGTWYATCLHNATPSRFATNS